jgi:hypothetical protein
MALAPGFGELETQRGLSPRPARQQPQGNNPRIALKAEVILCLLLRRLKSVLMLKRITLIPQ